MLFVGLLILLTNEQLEVGSIGTINTAGILDCYTCKGRIRPPARRCVNYTESPIATATPAGLPQVRCEVFMTGVSNTVAVLTHSTIFKIT